jgi:hypothetical protein
MLFWQFFIAVPNGRRRVTWLNLIRVQIIDKAGNLHQNNRRLLPRLEGEIWLWRHTKNFLEFDENKPLAGKNEI